MKSLLKLFVFLNLMIALSGCEALSAWRDTFKKKTSETFGRASQKVDEIGTQFEKTKESVNKKAREIQQAAKEVQEAAKEVQEAVEAVKKVTGSGTGTP